MTLPSGMKLGPYEILAPLGAGGMGEVYRARDTRLGRDVAIKVLPEEFAKDPERLRRFEGEARAASALSDPHIVTVFDVGADCGVHWFATELVEGADLRTLIASDGLPVRRVLELAEQIASGLAAAHEKGIVHRDLKPENVLITKKGTAKIADFGLAKLVEGRADGGSQLPTSDGHHTSAGVVMGTVAYMSPEQTRGAAVDFRSDQFAFGAIIHEMLTGRSVFRRASTAETLAAILREDPEPLSPSVPAPLRWIVERCLAKEPGRRYGSSDDLKHDLETLREHLSEASGSVAAAAAARPGSARRRLPLAAVALIAAAAIAFWAGRAVRPRASASPVRVLRLTDSAGLQESPALSPDGKSVAFTTVVDRFRQISVRLLAGGAPLQLTRDPADHLAPRWAPDSSSIVYFSPSGKPQTPGTIWEIAALGGAPRRLASAVSGADVSHDGSRLVYFGLKGRQPELVVAARDGSAPKVLDATFDPEIYYSNPRWSPDDRTIAFQAGNGFLFDIFAIPARGGKRRRITRENGIVRGFTWLPAGGGIAFSTAARGDTMVYLPTFNLWGVGADGSGLRQLTFGETSYVEPDAGAGRILASRVRMHFDLWRIPTDGQPAENVRRAVALTHQTGVVLTPSLAPDGRQLAYLADTGGHSNLWILDIGSRNRREITFEKDPSVSIGVPNWSPDGRRIAFIHQSPGGTANWIVDAEGGTPTPYAEDASWATWSPDGKWLYYQTDNPLRLVKMPAAGGSPTAVRTDGAEAPAISPDGKTLYFLLEPADVTGGSVWEVRAATPESGPSTLLARVPASRIPPWQLFQPTLSSDGRFLTLALTDGATTNVWALSTSDGSLRPLTDFGDRATFIVRRVCWAPDGKSIFLSLGEGDANVVSIEGLRSGPP